MDEEEAVQPTYKVGDLVKHAADSDDMEMTGTVVEVDIDPKGEQWLVIEWDQWNTHADQVKPA